MNLKTKLLSIILCCALILPSAHFTVNNFIKEPNDIFDYSHAYADGNPALSNTESKSAITTFSGKYSNSQVEITFPDGWLGSRMELLNQTIILMHKNSPGVTLFTGPSIALTVVDKSYYQKAYGNIDLSNTTNFRQLVGHSKIKDLGVASLTSVTINGISGEKMSEQGAGAHPQKDDIYGFVIDGKILFLAFYANPTEFEKNSADFSTTLNSLKISTVKATHANAENISTLSNTGLYGFATFSGKYSNPQGVEITFPDGWNGTKIDAANMTAISIRNNVDTITPLINFEIVNVSTVQKILGQLLNMSSNPIFRQALSQNSAGCQAPHQNMISINGMAGIRIGTQCPRSPLLPINSDYVIFFTKENLIMLSLYTMPNEFVKYDKIFNSTLNTLKIKNTQDMSSFVTNFEKQIQSSGILKIQNNGKNNINSTQTKLIQNTVPKLQVQTGINQKTTGNATNVDGKMKHFEQIRDKLMHSQFHPNPLARAQ